MRAGERPGGRDEEGWRRGVREWRVKVVKADVSDLQAGGVSHCAHTDGMMRGAQRLGDQFMELISEATVYAILTHSIG